MVHAEGLGRGAARGLFAAVFWRGEKLDLSHTLPGGEYVSAVLCSTALTQFFPGNPGGESVSALLHSRALTEFSGIKPKGWYAAEVLWK